MKSVPRQERKAVGKNVLRESSMAEKIMMLLNENVSYTVLCCVTAILTILITALLLLKLSKKNNKHEGNEKTPGLKTCVLKDVDQKSSDDEGIADSQLKDENSEEDLPWLLQKPSVVMLNHEGEESDDCYDGNKLNSDGKLKNDSKEGNIAAGGDSACTKIEESDEW
ncbi:Hypothetical protein NTJ_00675 [Nesidiocoris tenuis]|uniref:Transmembrane protein n=1 Tax=Nesidiocoris tenuis TaxID=355587 RepID=A0ABN7A9P9_9HEMI|nr:Hypothetical protein NTJ_00675 [Nesidiocoris tenuis]